MKKTLTILLTFFLVATLQAQDSTGRTPEKPSGLSVYLDCTTCEAIFFSEHLDLVSFIMEPSAADVRLVISEMDQGSGYLAISMVFTGQKRYSGFNDTVFFQVPSDITMDEKRNRQLDKIQLGLVPFLMKTPAANRLFLLVGEHSQVENAVEVEKDPWKEWTFELEGTGSLYNQKSYKSYNLNFGINVGKITEDMKLESYNRLDYNETRFTYVSYDSNIYKYTAYRKGFYSKNLLVKSLGKHIGIGGMGILLTDHSNNMDLRFQAGPAVEYNLFPYKEALQRQFRFLYSALYECTVYVDTTIYNKTYDHGWRQNLKIMARFNSTWGYLDACITASEYIHDMSRYSLGASVMANVRLFTGLSLNLMCETGMYRDRINQARGYATPEEILTRQQEMETDYQSNFSFGFTYRFGSKKYPALNPRFSYY